MTRPTAFTRQIIPQHPLAKLAIEQIQTQNESQSLRAQDILKAMGYQPKNLIQAYDRLRHVLCSPNLGLDNSYYDFRYSANEFLQALFAVLDIVPEQYQLQLEQIKQELESYAKRPRYSLRAVIDFDFSTSRANNWLTKMGVIRFYELDLPSEFYRVEPSEQHHIVQPLIQAHYQQYHDTLPYHGIIKGYVLRVERGEEIEQVTYEIPC